MALRVDGAVDHTNGKRNAWRIANDGSNAVPTASSTA